ncbi:MAG: enolase C-terminal domain-like protein [Gemmataceae bacterium]
MQITTDLLRLSFPKLRSLPRADDTDAGAPLHDGVTVLVVRLMDGDGRTGIGFTTTFSTGRYLATAVVDELAPRLADADARRPAAVALPRSVPAAARAAVDIALWDLAARTAGLPLWQYLGGVRDRVPAVCAETSWPWLGGEQILAAYEPFQAMGVAGLRVGVGGRDPEADARRLQHAREHLGLDDVFVVDGGRGYDASTALAMGRFLEEELDADWFDDPVADAAGLRRLAETLEIPVGAGGAWDLVGDFATWCAGTSAGVLRPDVTRLGISGAINIVALGSAFGRPVVPILAPEVSVHLACGRPGVRAVECVRWLAPLWKVGPVIEAGQILPPPGLGLGLELDEAAIPTYRVG